MKVLQLCNKPPYPPVDGGTLAMNSITQGLLAQGHEVRVLSMYSDKHPVRKAQMDPQYIEKTRFESVYVDLSIRPIPALVALLCGESYHVKRFESKDFERKLIETLKSETFDVVHLESIFLGPCVETIRKYSKAPIVLRAHNVEHRIWQRVAEGTRNPLKRWYLKYLALALSAYERERANRFDGIACITDTDAECFRQMGCRKPTLNLPFGITPESVDNVQVEENSLFHLGSMDWMPNLEGVRWFLDEVWPKVHSEVPTARLYLAGRKMPESLLKAQYDGVKIVGEVPDAVYFIGSKQINVVPLLSGSGIRVKIIEAMSVGKTVITTSVGAEGIHYVDGEHLLIADTPDDFVRQIKRCIDDKEYCRRVGQNAYNLIATEYSTDALALKLADFYQQLLARQ